MCWYSEVGTESRLWVERPRNLVSILSPRIRIWVSRKHLYDIWILPRILFNELQGSPHSPYALPPPPNECKSATNIPSNVDVMKSWATIDGFTRLLAVHNKYFVVATITVKCHYYVFPLSYDCESYPWTLHYPNSLRHIKTWHLCSISSPENKTFPPAKHLHLQKGLL
jgi:hypothetical protein